jgi:hypothetical protein
MEKIRPEIAQEFTAKLEKLKREFPIPAVDGLGV